MQEATAEPIAEVPRAAAPAPRAPVSLADTGLSAEQLGQLLLKWLYGGEASGTQLSDRLRLPYSILESLIDAARAEKLIQVRGAAGTGTAVCSRPWSEISNPSVIDSARRQHAAVRRKDIYLRKDCVAVDNDRERLAKVYIGNI